MITQTVHIGSGAISQVQAVLQQINANSVFIVADRMAYDDSGAKKHLEHALESRECTIFVDFVPNPKLADVMHGVKTWQDRPCDVMLAVGGGSAIDMAKLIRFCAAHQEPYRELLMGKRPGENRGVPLVAIPTTAGTGSEATHFAVVYIDGQKYSVAHESVLPEYAIIDSDLTTNLPAAITAHTGLDALAQAVESLWSVNATEESRIYASEALTLVLKNLEGAVYEPNPEVRLNMCRAAHLAGKAINISKTTAPHAISYTITSQFGVAHGLAVALTLGAVLVHNDAVTDADCWHPKGIAQVRQALNHIYEIMGCDGPDAAQKRIDDLIAAIGCPTRLADVGVSSDADLETIVCTVNTERLKNNPRALAQADLRALLKQRM